MQTLELARDDLDAVLFDMDGVLTDTASVHEAAWREVFDEALRARAGSPTEALGPFTHADYLAHVDGRPREDGIRGFLASRGIDLPQDDPSDPSGLASVRGIAERKDRVFRERLRSGVTVYPSTLVLVDALEAAGIRTALFTASRNMAAVLEAAGVGDRFHVRFGGVEREALGLDGKQAALLAVVSSLGVAPPRAAVVEDSRFGVEAARTDGFGLVVGVDRGGNAHALRDAGADAVVPDLSQVRLGPPPRLRDLPSALDPHDGLEELAGRRVAAFLDYDGTLTPIVERPEDAHLPAATRRALEELAATIPVAILSGRDLDDVRAMVGIGSIAYAGSHGFDIVTATGDRHQWAKEYLPDLDDAGVDLAPLVDAIAGARVERKRFAIAVHYRQVAPPERPAVEAAVERVARAHPRLRRTGGKMVAELRPDVDWDKGSALRWLLQVLELDRPDVVAVYVGDDETDEDAFRQVRATGLGVVVRGEADDRPTLARRALADPDEVRTFLERLATVGGTR